MFFNVITNSYIYVEYTAHLLTRFTQLQVTLYREVCLPKLTQNSYSKIDHSIPICLCNSPIPSFTVLCFRLLYVVFLSIKWTYVMSFTEDLILLFCTFSLLSFTIVWVVFRVPAFKPYTVLNLIPYHWRIYWTTFQTIFNKILTTRGTLSHPFTVLPVKMTTLVELFFITPTVDICYFLFLLDSLQYPTFLVV